MLEGGDGLPQDSVSRNTKEDATNEQSREIIQCFYQEL